MSFCLDFQNAFFAKFLTIVKILSIFPDVNNYQTSTIHISSHEISKRLRNELHSTIWTSPKSKEDTINGKTISDSQNEKKLTKRGILLTTYNV